MKKRSARSKSVHFLGIGGIGVSSLARWYLTQGWNVSGSDLAPNEITHDLQKEGIKIKFGHKKINLPLKTDLVIRSQAVSLMNTELTYAKKRHIPILSYPEAVHELAKQYKVVAVAGAHGKSTTTALLSFMLKEAKLDPTVIIGTNLREFGGNNFRSGKSEYLVLEADEYGKAFLHYFPTVAVITNIDREHLEIYKNSLANIKRNFLKFVSNITPHGMLVVNRDDKNLHSLAPKIKRIAKRRNLLVTWYSTRNKSAKKIAKRLKIFGEHNLSNAAGAVVAAKLMGAKDAAIFKVLKSFGGAWRRMEYRGQLKIQDSRFKIQVYDDYAHHPTEVKATLQAFRDQFPRSPLVCVFEPHHASRLASLFKEFTSAFTDADIVLIPPLYHVAGRDAQVKVDSQKLVRAMQKKYPKKLIFYLSDLKNLKSVLTTLIASPILRPYKKNPILVMMGAGNIFRTTEALLKN